ncbi:neck protein [Oceanospirillum phage vB_OsaM_PD0307]|nr:neck protein [Oceanospirillum phage vB_OsaM_PD0307]
MTITVNAAQLRQLEGKLEDLNKKGLQFAELETVNRAAFEAQKDARRELGGRMVLRNAWSERSILVRKGSLQTMESAVGSTQQYMETQELGGREQATGKHGVAIPTAVASGEGRGAKPRQKMVRRPNKVSNITLARNARSSNRKQRNAIAVKEAIETGRRYIFLELQRRKGLFRVYGGKRKPRVEMIQDLTRKTVRIPRNPWLMPAANKQVAHLPRYYAAALDRQLARLR